jgi:peptidoglycan/xylan/chitin deacetylase (PgdA/CDA1 family)
MKLFAKRLLTKTHALDLISRMTRDDRIEILLYHGFCEGSVRMSGSLSKLMPIKTFEEQIGIFARYGRSLRLEDVSRGTASGIVLSFDDGYASNYHLAFPILEKYGFTATVFLTTGFIDRSVHLWSDWLECLLMNAPRADTVFQWRGSVINLQLATPGAPERLATELKRKLRQHPISEIHGFLQALESHFQLRYGWDDVPQLLKPLNWNEIRAMRRSGLVSFGAHTVSHPVLSRCSATVQQYEIYESKRRIEEEIGESCTTFAYPYGTVADYNPVTKRIVKEAGFALAASTVSGSNCASSCDQYALRRWGVDISGDELSYLVSGAQSAVARFAGGSVFVNTGHHVLSKPGKDRLCE